jgi:hypothetical protein
VTAAPFCTVLYRRAWDLTSADVIRLGPGQGEWDPPRRTTPEEPLHLYHRLAHSRVPAKT